MVQKSGIKSHLLYGMMVMILLIDKTFTSFSLLIVYELTLQRKKKTRINNTNKCYNQRQQLCINIKY